MTAPISSKDSTFRLGARPDRGFCWRTECRRAYADYRTVAFEPNRLVARCHRGEYHTISDLRAELWVHVG